jgi:hypothetical protein
MAVIDGTAVLERRSAVRRVTLAIVLTVVASAVSPTFEKLVLAQGNCPSGIRIHVASANELISLWSPIGGDDYYVSRAWDIGTHTGRDRFSLDLSMPGYADLGKPVFLPFTARVWRANNGPYGNTAMAWDPGSGIVIRLAHMASFSSAVTNTWGDWLGAGTKVGYIGETGCPGCGSHLHVSAYRNVLVGAQVAGRTVTEQEITNSLAQGQTPASAQAQRFRFVAPSNNCEVIRFGKDPAIYTLKNGRLFPVALDGWRSWGMSVNWNPVEGWLDQVARITYRSLQETDRRSYAFSTQLADPREESVFRGGQRADTYVFRWGQKMLLSATQFGDQSWHEYRWSEVQMMDQSFVDQVHPRTQR